MKSESEYKALVVFIYFFFESYRVSSMQVGQEIVPVIAKPPNTGSPLVRHLAVLTVVLFV